MTIKMATHRITENAGIHLGTAPLHFKRILFATDFSTQASAAFKWAARFSQHFGSKLYLAHVLAPVYYAAGSGVVAPVLQEVETKQAQEKLAQYFSRMPELNSMKHEEIITCGLAKELIRSIAEENQIDLVVMGSHGRGGISKLALGSVAESALRHLHCPVLVCGPQCKRTYQDLESIVLATDLSVSSLRATQYASALAEEFHAQLIIVHVLPSDTENGETTAAQKREASEEINELVPAVAELRKNTQYNIRRGDLAPELLQIAKLAKANLIVMGVHEEQTMADHAPWATISKVIRGAHYPVLAVQPHIV
jgi:nucleotide-binding universal stress UspA family protein